MTSDHIRISLDEIGVQEGTDKSSSGHDYLNTYEEMFSRWRDEPISIVEIGGRQADSARTWSRYFSRADIAVIDVAPCDDLEKIERVTPIAIRSASEANFIAAIGDIRPTIIIDDGTHRFADQAAALNALFPALTNEGVYVIEDLHTSFGGLRSRYGDDEGTMFSELSKLSGLVLGSSDEYGSLSRVSATVVESVRSVAFSRQFAAIYKSRSAGKLFRRRHVDEFDSADHVRRTNFTSYLRLPPELHGAPPWVDKTFRSLAAEGEVTFPPARSAILSNARVTFGGVVFDESGSIADESLNCIQNLRETPRFYQLPGSTHWLAKDYRAPTVEYGAIKDRQHVLIKSAWDANYGHWLYDSFARVSLLESMNLSKKPLLVIDSHGGAISKVMRKSLELVGFQDEDIVVHDFRSDALFESLLVPGLVSQHPARKAPEATDYLRALTGRVTPGGEKRIYLSRNAYSRRRLCNEDELWPVFEQHGFVRVESERLTLEEQISAFSGAEIVAGNLGAAFSSLAFAPMGVQVLALTTEAMPHDFFYDIVCQKAGRYVGLQGVAVNSEPDMASDFNIAPETVASHLDGIVRDS